MNKIVLVLLAIFGVGSWGCTPTTPSRDEVIAVEMLSALRGHEEKDERPYLVTLKSIGGNFDIAARRRILAKIEDRGHKFVDALVVDPRSEFKWGQELKQYRALITFEIVSWISDIEVIVKSSNTRGPLSGGSGTVRMKKENGVWVATETIESVVF